MPDVLIGGELIEKKPAKPVPDVQVANTAKPAKRGTWSRLRNFWLKKAGRLSRSALLVHGVMLAFNRDGFTTIGAEQIQKATGLSRGSVSRGTNELMKAGCIKRVKIGAKSYGVSVYRVNVIERGKA
tara:strand:+ start:395 stop:775 length:381 start_codon:yes stop_codon:yes gene_type:complete